MKLSVIIPTLNEQDNLSRLIDRLLEGSRETDTEVIVVDGNSDDDTVAIASSYGIKTLNCPTAGRAAQLNLGASEAKSDLLYFVHGDTLPPLSFYTDIDKALKLGYDLGCYRFRFESSSFLLRINSYFTRFNRMWCRGGDQSLFVKRSVFEDLDGFKNDYVIMEDFDFLRRARRHYRFCIMPKDILVSARKYQNNSYLRVQLANLIVFNMFRHGYQPRQILKTYRKLINYRS